MSKSAAAGEGVVQPSGASPVCAYWGWAALCLPPVAGLVFIYSCSTEQQDTIEICIKRAAKRRLPGVPD